VSGHHREFENGLLELVHGWVVADSMASVLPADVVVLVEDDHARSLDGVASDVLGPEALTKRACVGGCATGVQQLESEAFVEADRAAELVIGVEE
jgi:hypothetical protein